MPNPAAPKKYTKIPTATGRNSIASIDENSEHEYDEHDFEAPAVECIEANHVSSFDGLSTDEKRAKFIEERASSKEIKYMQDERFNDASSPHYRLTLVRHAFTTNLVNDHTILRGYRWLCRVDIDAEVDDGGVTMIKLVKLWMMIIISIMILHPLARWMKWEVDENYTITDFYLYDFTAVLLDILFFFFVGRIYDSQVNVDQLFPWGVFVVLGCIYPSITNDFTFLRHSLSMYEVMCNWPPILFVYVATLLVLGIMLGVGLIRSHWQRNVLVSRVIELVVLVCVFILPYASNDNFHLHHWFGMWLLGMLSNAPEWWSRSFQAYCLGSYINGISIYGRDPILGCNLAFYRSTNMECNYMACYEADGIAGNATTHHYKSFVAPDWRTCNATDLP